jgi:hypothetical protein
MSELTPKQRAEALIHLRKQSVMLSTWEGPENDRYLYKRYAIEYAAAADALEALPQVAEQNRLMREALEGVQEIAESVECPACGASIGEHVNGGYYDRDADWTCHGKSPGGTEDVVWQVDAIRKMQAALALTPTDAEAQAAANAEKAALLDWLFAEIDEWNTTNLKRCREKWNGEDSFLDFCRSAKEADRG